MTPAPASAVGRRPRVLVVTSCTGEKRVNPPGVLTLEDFRRDAEHVARRETALAEFAMPAADLYTGQQHLRLMRGVTVARASGLAVDVWILSAGYGLIPGYQRIAPYEATFHGMSSKELRRWADALQTPEKFRWVVGQPYDLVLVLLGDAYLKAAKPDIDVRLGGPTILFVSGTAAAKMPKLHGCIAVPLANPEARRFSCGVIGLKGELAARALEHLAAGTAISALTAASPTGLLATLDAPRAAAPKPATRMAPRASVAQPISRAQPATTLPRQVRFFLPDCDDRVDPGFDFATDTRSAPGSRATEVYAHELYSTLNCDGLLVSRMEAESPKAKAKALVELGVHRYLRVPREVPVMGDPGAFGYADQTSPPFATADLVAYYSRLGFDLAVSLDHIAAAAPTEEIRRARYELTISNAREFLAEHRAVGASWAPVGAVQGWDASSYAEAARLEASMGYTYLALGGLVMRPTAEVLSIVRAVRDAVPPAVGLHLFGLAREEATAEFAKLGVWSVDSTSSLRRAWLSAKGNYLTLSGEPFTAIRIPYSDGRGSTRLEPAERARAAALERACLDGVSRASGSAPEGLLDMLEEYAALMLPGRSSLRAEYRRTLEAQPWRQCPCAICRACGVQVLIFRGNDRNRRRGFHNVWTWFRRFKAAQAVREDVRGDA